MSVANGMKGSSDSGARKPRAKAFVPPSTRAQAPQRLRAKEAIPEEYLNLLNDSLKRKGWSMAELARQIGASRSAVTKWFGGEGKPDRRYIPALSQHLGIPKLDLWRFYVDLSLNTTGGGDDRRLYDVLVTPVGISGEARAEALAEVAALYPVICALREQARAARLLRAEAQKAMLGAIIEEQSDTRQQASPAKQAPLPPEATLAAVPPTPDTPS
jgi:transcriptional regulator with XRE-family HTH domain